jgi:hypothetical protein
LFCAHRNMVIFTLKLMVAAAAVRPQELRAAYGSRALVQIRWEEDVPRLQLLYGRAARRTLSHNIIS